MDPTSQFLFSYKKNITSSVWRNYHRTPHNIPEDRGSHRVFSFYVPSIKSRNLRTRHFITRNDIPWNTENINFLLAEMTTNSALHDTVHK